MEGFQNIALGFATALQPENLLLCLCGVLLGTFIGILPGVGPLITIAVLLPVTFGLPPEGAIIMLAGIYYGAQYGGSTTAILVNLPGEASSVVTMMDGHAMAKRGRAGAALAIAAIGSFIAGVIGTILIAVFSPALASVAMQFGPAEYFALMAFALCCTSALVQGSVLKGVVMAMLGALVGLIGTDINSGVSRLDFGFRELSNGIEFSALAIGLFGIAEMVRHLGDPEPKGQVTVKTGRILPTLEDLKVSIGPILRGTGLGTLIGILPGAGLSISSFAAYILEKKVAKDPSQFGKGAIQGVAAPEAANNAAAQTSFIPTLTLGIPGSATMALMLGALLIQGITPGPRIMQEQPTLFWGLIASMVIGNLLLLVLNLPLVRLWVKLLDVPYRWLCPAILTFGCVGIYSIGFAASDIYIAAAFGLAGYLFLKLDLELAPFILGFILAPMLEEHFRRAMLLSRGDLTVFVTHPLSATFLGLIVVLIGLIGVHKYRSYLADRAAAAAARG